MPHGVQGSATIQSWRIKTLFFFPSHSKIITKPPLRKLREQEGAAGGCPELVVVNAGNSTTASAKMKRAFSTSGSHLQGAILTSRHVRRVCISWDRKLHIHT